MKRLLQEPKLLSRPRLLNPSKAAPIDNVWEGLPLAWGRSSFSFVARLAY